MRKRPSNSNTASNTGTKKPSSRQQTNLNHFLGLGGGSAPQAAAAAETERCPHCTASFAAGDVGALIAHVESQHLSNNSLTLPQPPLPAAVETEHTSTHWWKQVFSGLDPVVAHIRFKSESAAAAGGGSGMSSSNSSSSVISQTLQPVRLSALASIAPVELVLNALPATLANTLLTQLLAQSKQHFVAGSWWFGGKQQTAPRASATYILSGGSADGQDMTQVGTQHQVCCFITCSM